MTEPNDAHAAKSAARLAAIVDAAVDGIITIDERGRIETFNPAAERMFGYSAAELLGENISTLMPPPDRQRHDGYVEAYLGGGRPKIIGVGREVEGLRKDGTVFPLHLSVGEASFSGGHGFVGILRDLSEVKQLEREFLQSQKMEAVGRLAGGIAHDFNNLLMGLIGCADMALSALADGESPESPIRELRDAANRGSAIVRKLLAFSRKSPDQATTADLGARIAAIEPMIRRLLGEDIELIVALDEDPAWVACDGAQLEQVLMNLVVNARHAMPSGGRLEIRLAVGERVALTVADTGCGMDADTQSRVFEPFFTTRSDGDGTGLGLSTVYAIVRASGGAISLESEVGRGTRFCLEFPLAAAPEPVAAPAPTPAPAHEAPRQPSQIHVLVVEDDALVRLTMRHYLTKRGFTVVEAGDGDGAMEAMEAAERPISVLVTDMVLPGTTGAELATALQKSHPRLAIVFASAHDPDMLRAEGRVQEGDIVLTKPFGESELIDAIERARARAKTGEN